MPHASIAWGKCVQRWYKRQKTLFPRYNNVVSIGTLFGTCGVTMQHLHGAGTVCEMTMQHLRGPFTVCKTTMQHLHSPFTVCEMTMQHLHSPFTVCGGTMQHLRGPFTVCETTMQHLRGLFTVCGGTMQHLHSPFTVCETIMQACIAFSQSPTRITRRRGRLASLSQRLCWQISRSFFTPFDCRS